MQTSLVVADLAHFEKKFRSMPVAVKYLPTCNVEQVQREAFFLKQCWHINLPILFGVNTSIKPYFMVTEFYGNGLLAPSTFKDVLHNIEQ